MPDLIPVEDNPFNINLHPVDYDPWAGAVQGDVGAAMQQQNAAEAQRRATVGHLLDRFTLPGRVAQGVQPETPGVMTEADAFRQNQLEDQARRWGPDQALSMIGGGVPMAERGALGAAGGGIKAYHGSPYDFERFDLSKIGTGEGAQAYGHGLYFAENPATAGDYRSQLSSGVSEYEGRVYPKNSIRGYALQDYDALGKEGAIRNIQDNIKHYEKYSPDTAELYRDALDFVNNLDPAKLKVDRGKMYEVSINADPEHFLDWDKPLSEQHPKVQEALARYGVKGDATDLGEFAGQKVQGVPRTGAEAIRALESASAMRDAPAWQGVPPNTNRSAAATDALREAGIPGIRYLDQGSRNPNGAVSLQTKYRAVHSLENSSDIGERFFAARYKENDGDLGRTISQLKADLAAHPNDATVQKTLQFAQDPGNQFEFRPPKQQTSNYVVFHDSPDFIKIIRKFGLAGLIGAGASHFTTTPVNHNPFAAQQ